MAFLTSRGGHTAVDLGRSRRDRGRCRSTGLRVAARPQRSRRAAAPARVGAGDRRRRRAFDQVGLKPDLGALVVGLTLAIHRRAPELAETLLGFKDILSSGSSCRSASAVHPEPAAIGGGR